MMKIVIADDNVKLAQGCKTTLEKHFPELKVSHVFYDGHSLMDYLDQEIPDLLITDIMMAGYSGLDACKRIREKSSAAQIIMITGYEKFSYAKQAISYQVNELISKPFDNKVLIATIQKAVHAPVLPYIVSLYEAIRNFSVPQFFKEHCTQLLEFTTDQMLFLIDGVMSRLDIEYDAESLSLDDRENCLLSLARQYYDSNSHISVTKQAKQFILEHYTDPNMSRIMVADYLNLSAAYISTVFKKDYGISINDYIFNSRLEYAKKLLVETNLSIRKIAEQSGFGSDKYFSQVFKESTGITPTQFQKVKENEEN